MSNNKDTKFDHLFWYLGGHTPDYQKDKNLIVHQVLSMGTMEDLRQLFRLYDHETIRHEFLKARPGLYYPNILEFSKFLLGVKKVDKNKYLKRI